MVKYLKKDKNGYVKLKKCGNIECVEKYSAESETIATEIAALKYFGSGNRCVISDGGHTFNLPNVPKLVSCRDRFRQTDTLSSPAHDTKSGAKNKIVMEYVRGIPLVEFSDKRMSPSWWRSLLYQLILIVSFFESRKILHNDFWDANIMITPIRGKLFGENFIVTVLDFQYTNQYTSRGAIRSKIIYSAVPEDVKEKRRLGWSAKFHRGGDLNQILGLLSDYKYIPIPGLREKLKKMVIKRENADFPYAITRTNPKTTGIAAQTTIFKLLGTKSVS